MRKINIDQSWTLFLDRDGVINTKIENGYVTRKEDFHFLPKVKEAIHSFVGKFHRIIIVTNQQCVGKGIATLEDINAVHAFMLEEIKATNGKIDKIYFAPQLAAENHIYRKPNNGMALAAKKDFPEIDFKKSILIGDSESDIEFGIKSDMLTIKIQTDKEMFTKANFTVNSLHQFATEII